MKRFLSLLLAVLMLMSCAMALAETTVYKEEGFAIDFSAIQDQTANYPFLKNYGVVIHEPFVGYIDVAYTGLPRNIVEIIDSILDETEDEAEYRDYNELTGALSTTIAEIVVTDAKTLAEAGADQATLEQCEITEFATLGDYHYFLIVPPVDRQLTIYDEAEDTGDYAVPPQEMKATALADIELVRSELLKQLQSAELFTPVDPAAEFIGQAIEFESVDLDGNVVKSADLFKDNKITMVNIWGTWCINCLNEMGELAEIHKRLREKGCGIVGVEYERDTMENVADAARKVFADNGVAYPNVWMPEGNPIFDQVRNYPFSFFVDSEGKILTYPIRGAAVSEYEPTFETLLAGGTIVQNPASGSTKGESGEYRVFVYDEAGSPVKGVVVQLCDESTCSFQKTNSDGMAIFQVEAPKVFDVHVAKVPKGYQSSDETYKTLDDFSNVNIFISKAE